MRNQSLIQPKLSAFEQYQENKVMEDELTPANCHLLAVQRSIQYVGEFVLGL